MKNIHESTQRKQVFSEADLDLDPVEALERRQEKILSKLADLRKTLDELTGRYGSVPIVSETKVAKSSSVSVKQGSIVVESPLSAGIHDIVINADPSSPPLSVFVLSEMLKQKFKVLATSYVHSSVKDVDRKLCDAFRNGSSVMRGQLQIALSVVWKKVEDGPELIVSPSKQTVITGEVNIVRYINRILNPSFDKEDIVMATSFDEWLDIAENQLLNGNSKQKTSALKSLNNTLKKNDWLVGSELSLADVVMWSALHQSQQVHGAPENVNKWMKACSNSPLFQSALTIVS